MFITAEEMKSVLYEYQVAEIVEDDTAIVEDGILAGVSEVKAYFTASNQRQWSDGRPRYDINAIFTAQGADRDPFVLRLCKTVAAWNICELSNVDILYDHVKERYENAIKTLEKIATMGQFVNSPALTPDLPTINEDNTNKKPFRYGSRHKFNHE